MFVRMAGDLKREGFRATERSTTEHTPLVSGVETVLWTTAQVGRRYRGVISRVAERFMVRWHSEEAKESRRRPESAKVGLQVKGGEGVYSLPCIVVVV